MMRSESTSALGQPSETKLMRRARSGGRGDSTSWEAMGADIGETEGGGQISEDRYQRTEDRWQTTEGRTERARSLPRVPSPVFRLPSSVLRPPSSVLRLRQMESPGF